MLLVSQVDFRPRGWCASSDVINIVHLDVGTSHLEER